MLIRLIFALLVLGILFWSYQKLKLAKPDERKKMLIKWAVYILVGVILLAVLTGRIHWLGAVFAMILAVAKIGFSSIIRILPFLNILRKNHAFGSPVFHTQHLKVQLDVQQGTITGTVLEGPHEGKNISELSATDLEELENYYRDLDKRSFYLIRVIRQRMGAQGQQSESTDFRSVGNPDVDEALQILGLNENPSKQDIIKAHRALISKLHPDKGGNDYLASRVNLAKEVLLKTYTD